jgi:toxin ParE1/3/4
MAAVYHTARARKDLGDIWFYLAERAGEERASRAVKRIEAASRLLATQPRMGRPRPQLREGLRSWPVGDYIVFYFPLPDGIRVVRVLHSRQSLPSRFD